MNERPAPISPRRSDYRDPTAPTLRDYLFVLGLFAGVLLVNGILALLLIELFRAIGWWEPWTPEGAQGAATELSGRLRLRTPLAN